MYTVTENRRPACYPDSIYPEWHTATFKTWNEAFNYAKRWLGRLHWSEDTANSLQNHMPAKYNGVDEIDIIEHK